MLLRTGLIGMGILITNSVFSQLDFGDAPDPSFPTVNANNGASHLITPLFLGNYIDGEIDGQPNGACNGDDLNQMIDDEDGIMFTTWVVPGQTANVNITASMPGFIDAWIDFNGNGTWADLGEQIFTNQAVTAGVNALTFNVPASASSFVMTQSRWRISSIGNLLFTGNAPDGEVEDYLIWLGNPTGDVVMDPDPALTFTQNEISMTYEPNQGHIIAAYNDNPYPGSPGIGVSFSPDNGQTWIAQQLPIPANPYAAGPFLDAFDPTITSDDLGNSFVAHISTDYNWTTGPASGLYVHRSSDGGATWSAPVTVDTQPNASGTPDPNFRFNDRCQIRADINPASPYYNNVYLTWIQDRGWNMSTPMSDIYVSVSTDGGNVFSGAQQVNATANDMGNMPVQAIASNGDVYILWIDYNVITGGAGVLLLNKSTDGGVNWGTELVVDTISLPPIQLNAGIETRAKGAAVLRTHPTNPNVLYVVYAANPTSGDEADIFFIKSIDAGTTWSGPLRLNDDGTLNDQILPWMEVKTNGVIDIVWYDRRNDPSDLFWDVYATTSIDGGNTFATNMQVNSTSAIAPTTNSGRWLGEYLGLAVSDTMAFIGYTSSAIDITGDVFFTSFVNPPVNIGLNSIDKNPSMLIYPNPAENQFTVELEGIQNYEPILLNSLGQSVDIKFEMFESKGIFNVTKLDSGIYFLQMVNQSEGDIVGVRRIVVE